MNKNIQALHKAIERLGGSFQFKEYKDCPAVSVNYFGEQTRMRVLEVEVDEDEVLMRVDDFTEEIYETIYADDVLEDGIEIILNTIKRVTTP